MTDSYKICLPTGAFLEAEETTGIYLLHVTI